MAGSISARLITTAAIAAGWTTAASAQGILPESVVPAETGAKVELIGSSKLGCGQGTAFWTTGNGSSQCAFDDATRGARITSRQETGFGSLEAYATVAHSSSGAFTPEQLLASPGTRSSVATDFLLVGFKGTAFENRLKLTAELATTKGVVEQLMVDDWRLANSTERTGSSALFRMDATLADTRAFKWSMSGEYRSVSEGYSIGRSFDLARYNSLPGTRLALSTKARVGQVTLKAGLEQASNPFGRSSARKAGVEFQGIALSFRSRDSSAALLEGSTLIEGRTHADSINMELDTVQLAAWLLPEVDSLPWMVPTSLYVGLNRSETENRFETSTDSYRRSSLGIDGSWETPIGDTGISYWHETRAGLVYGSLQTSESIGLDHSVQFGNWHFGADAWLSRSGGDGSRGYSERSLSFGQSLSYSVPEGPELRVHLGQDVGAMRMSEESYVSADRYSSITASLDLSRYLQKRFERPDLRLRFDYRKVVDRSDGELSLYDEIIDRWSDSFRRQGFLMSFGMKL